MILHRIECLDGPFEGQNFLFRQKAFRISGREDADLSLPGVPESEGTLRLEARGEDLVVLVSGAVRSGVDLNGEAAPSEIEIQPGDEIEFCGFRLRYVPVHPPEPARKRSRSFFEIASALFVSALLLGQLLFLVWTTPSWRSSVNSEILRPTPTPIPEPTPTPGPSPTPLPPTPTPIPGELPPQPTAVPPPTPTPRPLPTATPLPDTAGLSVDELLALANETVKAGRSLEAERLLKQALVLDPERPELHESYAKLLSKESRLRESIHQWQLAKKYSKDNQAMQRRATLEIQVLQRRLEVLERRPVPTRIMPTARPTRAIPTPTPRSSFPQQQAQLQAEALKVNRYPPTKLYQDLRVLNFSIVHQPGTPAVAENSITVQIQFIEQKDGKLIRAEIPSPMISLDIEQGLKRGQRIDDLSAAYQVPAERKGSGRFYGAILRILIQGKEVSRSAEPPILLKKEEP